MEGGGLMGIVIAIGIACLGLAITAFGLGFSVGLWYARRKK